MNEQNASPETQYAHPEGLQVGMEIRLLDMNDPLIEGRIVTITEIDEDGDPWGSLTGLTSMTGRCCEAAAGNRCEIVSDIASNYPDKVLDAALDAAPYKVVAQGIPASKDCDGPSKITHDFSSIESMAPLIEPPPVGSIVLLPADLRAKCAATEEAIVAHRAIKTLASFRAITAASRDQWESVATFLGFESVRDMWDHNVGLSTVDAAGSAVADKVDTVEVAGVVLLQDGRPDTDEVLKTIDASSGELRARLDDALSADSAFKEASENDEAASSAMFSAAARAFGYASLEALHSDGKKINRRGKSFVLIAGAPAKNLAGLASLLALFER